MSAVSIDDEHGIGRGRERGLHGALRAHHARLHRLAIVAEPRGHGVERAGELAEFVARQHRHVAVELAIAQRHGRGREDLNGLQQRTREPPPDEQREHHGHRHCSEQHAFGFGGELLGERGILLRRGIIAERKRLDGVEHAPESRFAGAQFGARARRPGEGGLAPGGIILKSLLQRGHERGAR